MARRRRVDTTGLPIAVRACDDVPVFGDTCPRWYEFNDGTTRLVKWHPSRNGPRGTYAELVASRLGQLIGAPVLPAEIVYVPQDVVPERDIRIGGHRGVHLSFRRMIGEQWRPIVHADHVVNVDELPAAAVLLAWLDVFGHAARVREVWLNQFVERVDPSSDRLAFRLIDLEQLFSSALWAVSEHTRPKVRHRIVPTVASAPGLYGMLRVHDAYALPAFFRRWIAWDNLGAALERVQRLTDDTIWRCFVDDVPDWWRVPENDRVSGAARAMWARDAIEGIIRRGNPWIPSALPTHPVNDLGAGGAGASGDALSALPRLQEKHSECR